MNVASGPWNKMKLKSFKALKHFLIVSFLNKVINLCKVKCIRLERRLSGLDAVVTDSSESILSHLLLKASRLWWFGDLVWWVVFKRQRSKIISVQKVKWNLYFASLLHPQPEVNSPEAQAIQTPSLSGSSRTQDTVEGGLHAPHISDACVCGCLWSTLSLWCICAGGTEGFT